MTDAELLSAAGDPIPTPANSAALVPASSTIKEDTALDHASDEDFLSTGLSDTSVKTYDFEFYLGKKNRNDRVAVLFPNQIFGVRAHYIDGYVVCLTKFKPGTDDPIGELAPCCVAKEMPKRRWGAWVAQYNVNEAGALLDPLSFAMRYWRFTDDKFVQLRNAHVEWNLEEHDLNITCTEEKYQKLTIQAAKICALRHPEFIKKYQIDLPGLLNKANALTNKARKTLATKITMEQLMEKLGKATAPTVVPGSTGTIDELESILAQS